ncbi:MAG: cytochrome c oxidase assembly protein [Pseudomonadota bacterium]
MSDNTTRSFDKNTADVASQHRRVAIKAASIAVVMLGMAYAAVPLYQIFCQVTGFAGTTQRATAAPENVLERKITIRFDSNISNGLVWKIAPTERTADVKIGENRLAFYRATNPTDKPVVGTASFNVAPESAGRYFNKLECFCFTEQTLKPGETVEMPVSFFVDPEIVNDSDARHITQITLSYTFYPVNEKQARKVSKTKGS